MAYFFDVVCYSVPVAEGYGEENGSEFVTSVGELQGLNNLQ